MEGRRPEESTRSGQDTSADELELPRLGGLISAVVFFSLFSLALLGLIESAGHYGCGAAISDELVDGEAITWPNTCLSAPWRAKVIAAGFGSAAIIGVIGGWFRTRAPSWVPLIPVALPIVALTRWGLDELQPGLANESTNLGLVQTMQYAWAWPITLIWPIGLVLGWLTGVFAASALKASCRRESGAAVSLVLAGVLVLAATFILILSGLVPDLFDSASDTRDRTHATAGMSAHWGTGTG